jgi:hypothetical protein
MADENSGIADLADLPTADMSVEDGEDQRSMSDAQDDDDASGDIIEIDDHGGLLILLVGSGEYPVIAFVSLAGRPERRLYSALRPPGASRFNTRVNALNFTT